MSQQMSSAWLVTREDTRQPLGVFVDLQTARREAFRCDLEIRCSTSRIYCVKDDVVTVSRIGMNNLNPQNSEGALYSFADSASLIPADPLKFEAYLAYQRALVEATNHLAAVNVRGAGWYNMANPMGPQLGRN